MKKFFLPLSARSRKTHQSRSRAGTDKTLADNFSLDGSMTSSLQPQQEPLGVGEYTYQTRTQHHQVYSSISPTFAEETVLSPPPPHAPPILVPNSRVNPPPPRTQRSASNSSDPARPISSSLKGMKKKKKGRGHIRFQVDRRCDCQIRHDAERGGPGKKNWKNEECTCAKSSLNQMKRRKYVSERLIKMAEEPGVSVNLIEEMRLQYYYLMVAVAFKFDWTKLSKSNQVKKVLKDSSVKAVNYRILGGPTQEEMKKFTQALKERLELDEHEQRNRQLVALSLENRRRRLDDASCEMLFQALKGNKSITYLDLRRNMFGSSGLLNICEHLNDTGITDLLLSTCKITDEGLNLESGLGLTLKTNIYLQSLDLSANRIEAPGIEWLCSGLASNQTLTVLNLRENCFKDEGAVTLANHLATTSVLEVLLLDANKLTDASGVKLARSLQTNKKLRRLHLVYNRLGNDTADMLIQTLLVKKTISGLNDADARHGHKKKRLKPNKVLQVLKLEINSDIDKELVDQIKSILSDKYRTVFTYPKPDQMQWSEDAKILCKKDEGARTISMTIKLLSEEDQALFRKMIKAEIKHCRKKHKLTMLERLLDESSKFQEANYLTENQSQPAVAHFGTSGSARRSKIRRRDPSQRLRKMSLSGDLNSHVKALNDSHSTLATNMTEMDENHKFRFGLSPGNGYLECIKAIVEIGKFDVYATDSFSRRFIDVLQTHPNNNIRTWSKLLNAFARHYTLDESVPFHESTTCVVKFGSDIYTGEQVAIKMMRDFSHFERELNSRKILQTQASPFMGQVSSRRSVQSSRKLRTNHTLKQVSSKDPYYLPVLAASEYKEAFDTSEKNPYFIIMPRAERSLFEVVHTERVAGIDLYQIRAIANAAATALKFVNDSGMIHGDFKPRNFVRMTRSETLERIDSMELTSSSRVQSQRSTESIEEVRDWKLIDFDSCIRHGKVVTDKFSSAYNSPEMARAILVQHENSSEQTLIADPRFDIWSFGVVLYELLTGTPLFVSNRLNDNLFSLREKIELLNWLEIDDERLQRIADTLEQNNKHNPRFPSGRDSFYINSAMDLVKRCLTSDPKQRITFQEILEHEFFINEPSAPDYRKQLGAVQSSSRTHFFLSHTQSQASGTVKDIYYCAKELGCFSWLDVKAGNLTLTGMHEGIRNANVFIQLLTRDALSSPYVIIELMWAMDLQKPYIFIHEEDNKQSQYPYNAESVIASYNNDSFLEKLCDQIGDVRKLRFDGILRTRQEEYFQNGLSSRDVLKLLLSQDVRKFIENNTTGSELIPYRRRNYETAAMMTHLMDRIGLITPEKLIGFATARRKKMRIKRHTEFVVLVGPLEGHPEAEQAFNHLKEGVQSSFMEMKEKEDTETTKPVSCKWKEIHADETLVLDSFADEGVFQVFVVFLTPGFFNCKHGTNVATLEAENSASEMPLISIEHGWFAQPKGVRQEELGDGDSYESIMMHSEVMPYRSREPRLYEHDAMLQEIQKRIIKLQSIPTK